MSRYPWEEYANRFLDLMVGVWADSTWKGMDRRLRRMGREIRGHYDAHRISTSSPRTMTPEDVRYHLVYRRNLGLTPSEYSHELTAMITFFDFCENTAVRVCLRKYPGLRPAREKVRYLPLDDDDLQKVLSSFSKVPELTEFRMIRSYAMLAIFIGCGCRTKELRFLDIDDLDVESWTLDIIHVKGEESYGAPRTVPVPPVVRPAVSAFLDVRADHCRRGSAALFPPMYGNTTYLSSNVIRKILSFALEDLGIETDPRTLRRTFGQIYLDSGIDSIESVSVLMGHSSTATTERYYARRRNDAAIEAARRAWGSGYSNDALNKDSSKPSGSKPDDAKIDDMVRTPGFEPEF